MTGPLTGLLLLLVNVVIAVPGTATTAPAAVPTAVPGTLPEGSARYRLELAGETIGVVMLSVRCQGTRCRARWESTTRLPAEAGGDIRVERFDRDVDRNGRSPDTPGGRPPAFLLELILRDATDGEHCLDVAEERSGRVQRGCGMADGREVLLTLDGEVERVSYGMDGFPERISIPAQRTRFVRDPGATVPGTPPHLFGVEVPGPATPDRGAKFCGVARDAAPTPTDRSAVMLLPLPDALGSNCREKAAAWVRDARGAGHAARTAVGVAWSGATWSWHAWAEAKVGERWIPVDPTFGQAPASSPRFTLARWEAGDERASTAAGRKILDCWGRARVEP